MVSDGGGDPVSSSATFIIPIKKKERKSSHIEEAPDDEAIVASYKGHVFSLNLLKSPLKHSWDISAAGLSPRTDKDRFQPFILKLTQGASATLLQTLSFQSNKINSSALANGHIEHWPREVSLTKLVCKRPALARPIISLHMISVFEDERGKKKKRQWHFWACVRVQPPNRKCI